MKLSLLNTTRVLVAKAQCLLGAVLFFDVWGLLGRMLFAVGMPVWLLRSHGNRNGRWSKCGVD